MKLRGKTVIVTGGAQGIGAATARRFANEGAIVLIGDMNQEVGLTTALEIRRTTGKIVSFHQLNILDVENIKAFIDDALILLGGRIDVLINNAGIIRDNLLVNMPDEDFDAVINVNLCGVERMTKAVVPTMIAQKHGVILNVSSVVAPGNIGQTNYAATKAGVESMTRTWAKELGRYGIRVNAVAPGFTNTQMVAGIPENVKEKFLKKIPLGRYAEPEEIAAAYAFLAGDDAQYITGTILAVNGGFSV